MQQIPDTRSMPKAKSRIKRQKAKKMHPLFALFIGFFGVFLLAIVFTAHIYKNVSPMQEVAGTTTEAIHRPLPSITPNLSQSCTILSSFSVQGPCREGFRSAKATCADGSAAQIKIGPGCRSITGWVAQVLMACRQHTSCNFATPTPQNTPTPGITSTSSTQ